MAGQRIAKKQLLKTIALLETGIQKYWGRPEFDDYLKNNFRLVRIGAGQKSALITGYYAPEIFASDRRTDRFCHPIYKTPSDLSAPSGKPPTRRQIDRGILANRGLEIAWTDDPIELYWLHVQGSGTLVYPDGRRRTAHFAASNRYPYTSIGRVLKDQKVPGASGWTLLEMDDYLRLDLKRALPILQNNQRYIFFSIDDEPVRGAGHIPLTPFRSAAADAAVLPTGVVCFLQYEMPLIEPDTQELLGHRDTAHFVCVQDTGAAIRGPGRIDLFMGAGKQARSQAGRLKHPLAVWLLLAK